jgi:hypothetical protein
MESLLPVIIGLAAGIAMIISFTVLMPTLPPQRQWMAFDVIQCGNPWEDFVSKRIAYDDINLFQDKLKQYYLIEENLTIYQMQQIENPLYGPIGCTGCGCYGGFTFATLIDVDEVDRTKMLGFYMLETPPPRQLPMPPKEPYANVAVDGLKASYRVGEQIEFAVKVEGYGCDAGFPQVRITRNAAPDKGIYDTQTFWYRVGEGTFVPAGCLSEYFSMVRHIGDVNDPNEQRYSHGNTGHEDLPIAMRYEGEYEIVISGGSLLRGQNVVREFEVISSST